MFLSCIISHVVPCSALSYHVIPTYVGFHTLLTTVKNTMPNEQPTQQPPGMLIATAKRGDTVREYYTYTPQNTYTLSTTLDDTDTRVYYNNAGNEVPSNAVTGYSHGHPYTYAEAASLALPKDRMFDVGHTCETKHRKSEEELEELMRREEVVEEPSTNNEVHATVDSYADANTAPSPSSPSYGTQYTAPTGQIHNWATTWRPRIKRKEGFMTDQLIFPGLIEEALTGLKERVAEARTKIRARIAAHRLDRDVRKEEHRRRAAFDIAEYARPYDKAIDVPFYYSKRKAEDVERDGGELKQGEEDIASPASLQSSHTVGRSEAGSSDPSYTVGRLHNISCPSSSSSDIVGCLEAGSSDSLHTIGRSDICSSPASSRTVGRSEAGFSSSEIASSVQGDDSHDSEEDGEEESEESDDEVERKSPMIRAIVQQELS
jgi:hypothetical protein